MKAIKNTRLQLVSVCLLSLAWLAVACQPGGYGLNTEVAGSGIDSGIPTDDPEASYGKTALGVKNFLQIYESMWTATKLEQYSGLPRSNATFNAIRNFYTSNKATLPSNNEVSSFSSSQMLAVTNLSWEFCDRIGELTAVRTQFFAGTSFVDISNNTTHQPSALLGTPAKRSEMVTVMLNQLWGEEVVQSPGRTSAESELNDLTLDLMTGAAASAQATRDILKGVCTAALSSAAVNLF